MITIAQPSVMSLLIELRFDGQPLATGTGFLSQTSKGPVLLTNRHNVTGRNQETGKPLSKTGGVPNQVAIIHNVKDRLGQWCEKVEHLYAEDQPRWKEHPTLTHQADVVALPLADIAGVQIISYDPSLANPDIAVAPADVISVIGFPFGMTGGGGALAIWATGFVASEPNLPNDQTFLIDCRSRPGQSGSAVIAYRGAGMVTLQNGDSVMYGGPVFRLLGIYSGRVNNESDLGIVWKSSIISQLIASV